MGRWNKLIHIGLGRQERPGGMEGRARLPAESARIRRQSDDTLSSKRKPIAGPAASVGGALQLKDVPQQTNAELGAKAVQRQGGEPRWSTLTALPVR
jgi:hypothetical protein